MNKILISIVIFLLSGCSSIKVDDLSNFSIKDFQSYKAPCNLNSQCKVIGYGRSTSCSEYNYVGYVIYSTKMGDDNISHLKTLVSKSRGLSMKRKNPLLIQASFELEECTLAEPVKPLAICASNICQNKNEN